MSSLITTERLVVLSAWASRIVSAGVMVLSLRVLSTTLRQPEYAIFIVLAGLIGWFALTDFGLGYALQNVIARKRMSSESASEEVVTAYLLILFLTSSVLLFLYLTQESLTDLLFSKMLNASAMSSSSTFFSASVILAIGGAAAVSTRILYGMNRGYVANIAAAFGSLIGLVILSLGIENARDKVLFAIAALYAPNTLINLFFGAIQIRTALKFKISLAWSSLRTLLKTASGFFVFYFVAAAALQMDYLILSQKILPKEIIHYFTLAKIFSFVGFFYQAILFAVWPRMTAAYSSGQNQHVIHLIKRLMLIGALIVIVCSVLILTFKQAFAQFLAPESGVIFRDTVILSFAAIALIRCLIDPYAIFLQSISQTKPLIIFVALQAVLGGGLQWLLADSFGIEGILLALLISFLCTVAWGLPWVALKFLKER